MAETKDIPLMNRSLFSWVLRGKRSYQLLLLVAILAIVFLRVLPLEIQKRLVNDVLSSGDFTRLFVYCLIYLGAVLSASTLKFFINSLQSYLGEQATADMRRDMYRHIMRLPLAFFRKTQPGTVVTSLVNELATTGTFVGVAVAIPLSNTLTLLAFAGYLLWLNPLLAVVTLSIYPVVFIIVPMVQKKADRANSERVDISREMASQITESVSGVQEVYAQGSFRTEEHKYNTLVERLLKIRIVWAVSKYAVKTTNNLILGVGPVLVFLVGGYLMMQGKLELGALVAFLSGQEKLYDPSRDLTKFYQIYQDAVVRYKKVLSAFDGDTEFKLDQEAGEPVDIGRRIEVKNLDFATAEGIKLLNQVSLKVEAGEHLALVGFSGSGKSTLAQCIGQLCRHTGGQALLDGYPIDELSKEEVIRNIGYISQEPFVFTGTVNENLLYGWNAVLNYPASSRSMIEPTLDDKIDVVQQAGLFIDILRFGLNTHLDHQAHPDLAETLLRVRQNFQENFGKELAEHVEFYREDRYLHHSSVKDNLIFGTPLQNDFNFDSLSESVTFLSFLDTCSLQLPLLETGADLLLQTVEILGDVPRENIFFTQTPIMPGEYDTCLSLAEKLQRVASDRLEPEERHLLLDIALRFIPAQHKIIALQPLLEKLILSGRKTFRSWCADNAPDAVSFYSDTHYISSQTILNNIFFGSLTSDSPKVEDRVNQCVVQLLVQEDLLERISAIGMDFNVGNRGDRLSGGQKQKLAIARVLLKQNGVVIMDEATSALDNKSQTRIQNVIAQWKGTRTVISVIHRLDMLPSFDKVAVLKDGKIIEWGNPEELIASKGALHELIHGKTH
jgi:ABC-type bacteriocin/lantibiotic exporter with double-glycine peptidase domain